MSTAIEHLQRGEELIEELEKIRKNIGGSEGRAVTAKLAELHIATATCKATIRTAFNTADIPDIDTPGDPWAPIENRTQ